MRYVIAAMIATLAVMAARPALATDKPKTVNLTPAEAGIVERNWDQMAAAFRAKSCLDAPTVRGVPDLVNEFGGPTVYDPATHTVSISKAYLHDYGSTPVLIPLIHDFAHHAEAVCHAVEGLSPKFQAAEGLNEEWFWGPGEVKDQATWQVKPTEHFAEIVVMLVAGTDQPEWGMTVSPSGVSLVKQWMQTPSLTPTTSPVKPSTTIETVTSPSRSHRWWPPVVAGALAVLMGAAVLIRRRRRQGAATKEEPVPVAGIVRWPIRPPKQHLTYDIDTLKSYAESCAESFDTEAT